jgi:hypothetical protein
MLIRQTDADDFPQILATMSRWSVTRTLNAQQHKGVGVALLRMAGKAALLGQGGS